MINRFSDILAKNDIKEFYGVYFLMWIVSLLYLFQHRKEREKMFLGFALPTVVAMLIVFNPICAIVIDKCLQASFWRVYWIFNIVIVIACTGTCIVFDLYKRNQRLVAIVSLFIAISALGTNVYQANNFKKAENAYKIPQAVIEVCDILVENEITENVAVDNDLAIWVRQYDATLSTLYGREFSGNIGWGVFTDDLDLVLQGLRNEDCDYIVIAKSRDWEVSLITEGYEKYAETEYYDIWKVR